MEIIVSPPMFHVERMNDGKIVVFVERDGNMEELDEELDDLVGQTMGQIWIAYVPNFGKVWISSLPKELTMVILRFEECNRE